MSRPFAYDEYYNDYTCLPCQRNFNRFEDLEKHLLNASCHGYCSRCQLDFPPGRGNALLSHFANSRAHSWCSMCRIDFQDDYDLQAHEQEDHERCHECQQLFKNDIGVHEHARQVHLDVYCSDCRRFFQSPTNFRVHRNSELHSPRNVPCPLRGCDRQLLTMADLVMHWESGACRSGFNRTHLNQFVRSQPASAFITNQKLLTSSIPFDEPSYIASEASWDGYRRAYVCFLCKSGFNDLRALNQHLASPKHSSIQNYWCCPKMGCGKTFTALSSLVSHCERGNCGVRDIPQVQNTMRRLVDSTRMIAF